ncbi:MAG: hypothetical protein HN704_07300 [Bacteroidetes bacterium]|jgi:hypothetical protein|nr:hypothetical protein [Bacteroidota bacterium]MBT6687644.1 hypothetical protein [Bacteroidota bacterium]MBT7144767.1 hypothetical protein [Bacteroidota bacterium]MBT7491394.1 hypothetical protein [Bacteroidota bacterium]
MRKPIVYLVILLIALVTSCSKEEVDPPDHKVRIENNCPFEISSFYVGSNSFGYIIFGETTTFQDIEEATHSIVGTLVGGASIFGSISVEGDGTHEWTIRIDFYGNFDITKD